MMSVFFLPQVFLEVLLADLKLFSFSKGVRFRLQFH